MADFQLVNYTCNKEGDAKRNNEDCGDVDMMEC